MATRTTTPTTTRPRSAATTRTARRPKRPDARRLLGVGAVVLLVSLWPAAASAWTCSNEDLEVACDAEGCGVSEAFTPMSVSFDNQGQMSVCAYSGCWEGRANQIASSNDWLILAASQLKWSGTGAHGATGIGVLLDRRTGIAVLNGAGYAHPMICRP